MAKYDFEFKKLMVLEYLNGQGSYDFISEKHGMDNSSQLKKWVASYLKWGDNALKRAHSKKIYSFEEKLNVVESYLSGGFSYQKLALQMGYNNPSLIVRWVREYKKAGPDALREHKKGRKIAVKNRKKRKTVAKAKQVAVDTSAEYVRELEQENYNLRLENAFLKEMRRLRLEDEARMRERHTSSTVSEDHSN